MTTKIEYIKNWIESFEPGPDMDQETREKISRLRDLVDETWAKLQYLGSAGVPAPHGEYLDEADAEFRERYDRDMTP